MKPLLALRVSDDTSTQESELSVVQDNIVQLRDEIDGMAMFVFK